MFFIFAWLSKTQNGDGLEDEVPLLFLGNYLKRQGSNQVFHIIFLDGYEQLSSNLRSKLKSVGFHLVNFSSECQRLMTAFQKLDRFGRYETLCFLRWPALWNYLKAENINEQVFHIDGDVIFNAQPEEIVNDVSGLTFVLQGCPAFVSITNHDWFECYCEALARFHRDIDRYSSLAWQERSGWERSHKEKWAGSRNRRTISSDQDLMSHLIHTGRIVQDNPSDFAKQLDLFYMENPLYFHSHAAAQLSKSSGLEFSSDGKTCYVENKKIAFWHFQSDFVRYISTARILHRLHYPCRFPNHLEPNGWDTVMALACSRVPRMSRLRTYSSFNELTTEKSHASLSFTDIFNRRAYWKEGVFSNGRS